MKTTNRDVIKLASVLKKIHSEHELEDFLIGILTPKEIIELSRRVDIVRMLKQGVQHHIIAERLGVGVATVTRGSKELQKGRLSYV